MKKWTIDDSRELYNINGWGTSYFGVNDKGDMYVTPCKDNVQIDLRDVMDELQLRDVTPPVLLRFPDILDNRIEKTSSCFIGRVKGRVFGKQFPQFLKIFLFILKSVRMTVLFISMEMQKIRNNMEADEKNCCKQLADSIFY